MQLSVNGRSYNIDVEEDMPLLWVLRDELGLTDTKFGCGIGQCGACTVHINGLPVRSCQIHASRVQGAVTTPAAIAPSDAERHPVQDAWIKHQVAQCGYCQSGQIMQAIYLLNRNKNPSDDDIDAVMSANLCRCGTYPRIREAIKTAARVMRGEA